MLPNVILILVAAQECPEVSLEEWSFLERIFRIPLQERTWKQLVTLDTFTSIMKVPSP